MEPRGCGPAGPRFFRKLRCSHRFRPDPRQGWRGKRIARDEMRGTGRAARSRNVLAVIRDAVYVRGGGTCVPRPRHSSLGHIAAPLSGAAAAARALDRPLAGATVTVAGQQRRAVTDQQGRFRITGVSGSQVQVRANLLGFGDASASVRVGESNVRLVLAEAAVALNAVVVTGTP